MLTFERLRFSIASVITVTLSLVLTSCGCSGCSDELGQAPGPGTSVVNSFFLEDVNPDSATHQSNVSPRQHLTRVSAWYFGHST